MIPLVALPAEGMGLVQCGICWTVIHTSRVDDHSAAMHPDELGVEVTGRAEWEAKNLRQDAPIEPAFETTDRGLRRLASITGWRDQDEIRVYESSNAEHPCIRVMIDETVTPVAHHVAHIQLTIENAAALRDQLDWMIRNHYQGRAK